MNKSGENRKAKVLWGLEEAKDKGAVFYNLGSVQQIQTRPQGRLDLLGNPPEEHSGCSGRRTETYTAKRWASPAMSNERIVKAEACGSCCSLACASRVNGAFSLLMRKEVRTVS